jgi:alanine dehydrogenase
MRIGVPRERAPGERRVGLTPHAVRLLIEHDHRVYVEAGAGHGAGYADESYRDAGTHIVYDEVEIFGRSEILAKIGPLEAEEVALLSSDQIVFAFHSALTRPAVLREGIRDQRLTLVSYEWIEDARGVRPVQNLMSEIAGSVAVLKGAQYLMSDQGGIGIAPGFVWGVPPSTFVVLGCGVAGSQAVRTAVGIGAHVVALDRDLARLCELDRVHGGRVVTTMADGHALDRAVRSADVLILAVSELAGTPPVTRDMVRGMRPRAVLVDLGVVAGGASETSRATTLAAPTYVEEGVTHLCLPNLTALVARSASRALANAAIEYLLPVADHGLAALDAIPELGRATAFRSGEPVHPLLAAAAERVAGGGRRVGRATAGARAARGARGAREEEARS